MFKEIGKTLEKDLGVGKETLEKAKLEYSRVCFLVEDFRFINTKTMVQISSLLSDAGGGGNSYSEIWCKWEMQQVFGRG